MSLPSISEYSNNSRGRLIVISGPAGVGKTTLCERLVEDFDHIRRLVTTTSRPPRGEEVDGVDYHFVSPQQFEKMIDNNEFIEWAKVHGRYYGSQRRHIEQALNEGNDLLLNIDVQGAQAFRKKMRDDPVLQAELLSVFIQPLSIEQIADRLKNRATDDEAEIARRLHTAREEIRQASEFDYQITSDSRENDYLELKKILNV
jgi:guanylate kinase